MRRIGSNIRRQNQEERQNRMPKNIIRYTDGEKPKNDYPKRIISPSKPTPRCCGNEKNKVQIGRIREVEGFKFSYRICQKCGHAVRYFYPAATGTSEKVKTYRKWNTYRAQ